MQATLSDVLDTVDEFTIEETEELIAILQSRLRDIKRSHILRSVEESRREFRSGVLRPQSVEEIMNEISS